MKIIVGSLTLKISCHFNEQKPLIKYECCVNAAQSNRHLY